MKVSYIFTSSLLPLYFVELCLKDAELSFKAMEFGSLKYMGQVRLVPVFGRSEMSGGGSKG